MEYRLNSLFKKHLEEVELSPITSIPKHVSNTSIEEDYSRLHLNKLCKMMENCEIELQNSSATMRQLVDKDGDFLIVHKNDIKKLFVDLKEDFQTFKEELKEDFQRCLSDISPAGDVAKLVKKTVHKKEQENACLTPPCSFETKEESSHFASAIKPAFTGKTAQTGVSKSPLYKYTPPIITYKVGKKSMKFQRQLVLPHRTSPRFTKQRRASPRVITKPPNKIKQTKHWLDTLQDQPSCVSSPSNNDDNASLASDWSCRSVRSARNVRSARKRGPIKARNIQSETGFEHRAKRVWGNNRDSRSNF